MRYGCVILLGIALLSACGGGGGSSGPGPTPIPFPTTSTTPVVTAANGVLVDHDTGAPMAGVTVGLAADVVGASPTPVATTDANGQFSFTASPGTYLMQIPAGTPMPNRPVIHQMVTIAAGVNNLQAPKIGPAPGATANPIEYSGNFRLTTETAAEQACLAYTQSKYTATPGTTLVADEWLQEDARWLALANGGNANILTNYDASGGSPSNDCRSLVDTFINDPKQWMDKANLIWFAGSVESVNGNYVAGAEGMFDPRGPLPAPTPGSTWP